MISKSVIAKWHNLNLPRLFLSHACDVFTHRQWAFPTLRFALRPRLKMVLYVAAHDLCKGKVKYAYETGAMEEVSFVWIDLCAGTV